MKHKILTVFVLISLAACNENKPDKDLSIAPLTTPKVAADTLLQPTSNANNLPTNQNVAIPQGGTTTPQNVVAATAPGMNPPHGQPGHRCEIKEGAPLNSSPAKPITTATSITQPTVVSQPTTTQPATTAAKTVTAKGMNPPHGETGHRCDISVGAPLNSAPNTATKPASANSSVNSTSVVAPTQNTSIVPALQNTTITTPAKPATAFTGKINPAHGQPGHDCKVAVGQPLP